ncbi:sulfotransferase domain-containing protein [Alteromonas sp. 14N.309.X.WAT.G.H12]|uniref:sulfotransferase domain-containing protein n=1 Tax=Alteromonas sp. 14N.309.X.WAT.G.H12 TaxID=3120824 RepID=UPI002FD7952D
MEPNFFIIAGSEKCGTTSLFQYLADSKLFNISIQKETDYFRKSVTPTIESYIEEFSASDLNKFFLEASPGYLTDSEIVADKIKNTLTNHHLFFCLRDPTDRFISSYNFRKSRLYIPTEMSLDDYFEQCCLFEQGKETDDRLDDWSLRTLDGGNYFKHLTNFERSGIKFTIIPFNDLAKNPRGILGSILRLANITSDFFDQYSFEKNNVTIGFKNKTLQRIALKVNKKLEYFWVKNPKVKKSALNLYRMLNGKKAPRKNIEDPVYSKIKEYYKKDYEMYNKDLLPKYRINISD